MINLDQLYRREAGRVLATLIRLLKDRDLAEEALQDAFSAAVEQWPRTGEPKNPTAWLISAGRFKAIDKIRRNTRGRVALGQIAMELEEEYPAPDTNEATIQDDVLRLIFVCCHPDISREGQIALTLREVCGLKTEEIADAFLTSPPTIAQRIVRAKNKIKAGAYRFDLPEGEELRVRLASALHTVYLVFNEGYASRRDDAYIRRELTDEAIRLARLISQLLPGPETAGLLAFMLLTHARSAARLNGSGEIVRLAEQDRSLWTSALIAEGAAIVERWNNTGAEAGIYLLQARIAAAHSLAPSSEATDWGAIAAHYSKLVEIWPSPVVALNRAVAIGEYRGYRAGLEALREAEGFGELESYSFYHITLGHFLEESGDYAGAVASYERALAITESSSEKRMIGDFVRRARDRSTEIGP